MVIIDELGYTQKQEERLRRLLSRGTSIAFALDELSNKGIQVIARGDKRYPILLKKRLLKKAPPLLYYVGNLELSNKIGIAFVGSRNIDVECENFTYQQEDIFSVQASRDMVSEKEETLLR